MPDITTIKISTETKARLEKLKEYDRETYNELINKVFYILNLCRKDPEKAQKSLINIDRRVKRKDIIKKRMKNSKE